MFSLSRLLAIAGLLIAAGGCQSLPPAEPAAIAKGDYAVVLDYLSQRIPYDMAAAKVPGVSVAIVDDQRVVWSTGFGYADVARHRRATGDTLYRVGAISKLVSAAGVLRAADEGRLPLDAPAASALPAWQLDSYRHAMPWMQADRHSARDLLALHPATLEDTAGRARADMAYGLLGEMVAQAVQEPFDAYVRRSLFAPLNMPRAGYAPHARMLEQRAIGYRRNAAWMEPPQPYVAADGLWISSSEMARFASMLFGSGAYQGKRVVAPADAQALLELDTVGSAALDLDCRLVLSWLAAPCGDALIAAPAVRTHSGATQAFQGRLLLSPQDKLAVLVLSNADAGEALVAAVSSSAMRMMRQAKNGTGAP